MLNISAACAPDKSDVLCSQAPYQEEAKVRYQALPSGAKQAQLTFEHETVLIMIITFLTLAEAFILYSETSHVGVGSLAHC